MKHAYREEDGVGIFALKGKLMGESDDLELIKMFDEVVDKGTCNAVLDFSDVLWSNSKGVGICMTGQEIFRSKGGDLRLACLCEKVSHIFDLTHISTLFKSFNTLDEAVASFKD